MSTQELPSPIDPRFTGYLDPDFVNYYNKNIAVKPVTHSITLAQIRAAPEQFSNPWARDYSDEPFVKNITLQAGDGHVFAARCYYPDPQSSAFGEGPYPIHINFHGGGFVLGDLTGDAEICMMIRNRVGILVLDVDYRLSPEHTFGKGHDDAWAAVRWIHEHGQEINALPSSISVGGISAGGHISAVIQQKARDANLPLKLAILAVPATNSHSGMKTAADSPYKSFQENEFAPCLNWKRMAWFSMHYRPKTEEEKQELEGLPGFIIRPIEGTLEGVCDSFIATAGADPLRDEGEEYARRLIEAGVRITARRYTGVPHPFMHMLSIKKAQMYIDDICGELKKAHGA